MRDLNQTDGSGESGWEWIAFWIDNADYWKSRFQATGEQHHLDSFDRCWRMVDLEIF